jgi:hypothetical protein
VDAQQCPGHDAKSDTAELSESGDAEESACQIATPNTCVR